MRCTETASSRGASCGSWFVVIDGTGRTWQLHTIRRPFYAHAAEGDVHDGGHIAELGLEGRTRVDDTLDGDEFAGLQTTLADFRDEESENTLTPLLVRRS